MEELMKHLSDTEDKRHRYDGFPIGLQLVGQRQMESKLSKIALLVEKVVRE